MVWARFDDGWIDEPVIMALSANAFRAYLSGLCYSARYLTDGRVPAIALRGNEPRAARELIKAELWEPVDAGWYAPRWHEHFPSRAEIETARDHNAERKRDYRRRRREGDE